ncbi:hypothetical protein LTR42_003375 [Elasticomyces elasticus]|nr:hypothetical protein LTR42_003375 [Elasticomyces elasticus]
MANTSGSIARITRELSQVQKNADISIAVAVKDSDVRHIRALIIGPPETPYEYGFFEFELKMPKDYPIKSPNVRAMTTNGGRTRFNPNIYAEGKLSDYDSNPGEEWSSAQGLESVLLSIQSLMSSNPYENEPGYETAKKGSPLPAAYVAKIRHETLRLSVLQRLETLLGISADRTSYLHLPKRARTEGSFSPSAKAGAEDAREKSPTATSSGASSPAAEAEVEVEVPGTPPPVSQIHQYDAAATFAALDTASWDPFGDLLKRRFLWYYDTYYATISANIAAKGEKGKPKEGEPFKRMEFEYPPNSMEGTFQYPTLLKRLEKVKAGLHQEEEQWVQEGKRLVKEDGQLATMLAFQSTQLSHKWNESNHSGSRMELSLPDKTNPFLWNLTFFGKPMTNLDGGLWNLTLHIPPTFPEAQPRVRFETPIFHHRVSGGGDLCYFPIKEGEISSHLEGIVAAVEDESPIYDPRAVVNPEAFGMFWGGEDKKKIYGRKLRRSAQDSAEFGGLSGDVSRW